MTTEKDCFERKENACNENRARQFAYKSRHLSTSFLQNNILYVKEFVTHFKTLFCTWKFLDDVVDWIF